MKVQGDGRTMSSLHLPAWPWPGPSRVHPRQTPQDGQGLGPQTGSSEPSHHPLTEEAAADASLQGVSTQGPSCRATGMLPPSHTHPQGAPHPPAP